MDEKGMALHPLPHRMVQPGGWGADEVMFELRRATRGGQTLGLVSSCWPRPAFWRQWRLCRPQTTYADSRASHADDQTRYFTSKRASASCFNQARFLELQCWIQKEVGMSGPVHSSWYVLRGLVTNLQTYEILSTGSASNRIHPASSLMHQRIYSYDRPSTDSDDQFWNETPAWEIFVKCLLSGCAIFCRSSIATAFWP